MHPNLMNFDDDKKRDTDVSPQATADKAPKKVQQRRRWTLFASPAMPALRQPSTS